MIRINLLPHREEKRKQKKAAFFALLAALATVHRQLKRMP